MAISISTVQSKRDNQMFASSLANGLRVLSAFSAEEPSLTNAVLAARTGLSRASITRLSFALTELGLLAFDTVNRQYRIGPGAIALGYPFLFHLRIQHVALPLMQDFADRHRATVSMGMRNGPNMVYIDSCRSFDGAQFRADGGVSLPLLRTAMGRAWIAAQPVPERKRAIAEFRQQSPSDWRRYAAAVRESIASCHEKGFCINRGDLHEDLQAVAVPLAPKIQGRHLVFNAGLPTELVGPGVLERLGERLLSLTLRIEAAWVAHE